jgi:hypothetical protein
MHLANFFRKIPARPVMWIMLIMMPLVFFTPNEVLRNMFMAVGYIAMALLILGDRARDGGRTKVLRKMKNALYAKVAKKFVTGMHAYINPDIRQVITFVPLHSRLLGPAYRISIMTTDRGDSLLDEPDMMTERIFFVPKRFSRIQKRTEMAFIARDEENEIDLIYPKSAPFAQTAVGLLRTDSTLLVADVDDLQMLIAAVDSLEHSCHAINLDDEENTH